MYSTPSPLMLTPHTHTPLTQQDGEEQTSYYTFFVNEQEVVNNLTSIVEQQNLGSEAVLRVTYQPQVLVMRVRCSDSG